MSEMVERVAKAIHGASRPHPDDTWEDYLPEARAAIEAMREPDKNMRQVVSANWGRKTWAQYDEVITAALEDK